MDLRTLSPFNPGAIVQYTPPQSCELEGKCFEFVMDDGYDYSLCFKSGDALLWGLGGGEQTEAKYFCQKGDDTTYLVSFELTGVSPRVNHTFVIDLEQYLVTRLISKIGTNPKYPYLISTEYEFGAIARPGVPVKLYPRHGFTSDLTGTVVQWMYAEELATVHLYYCTDFYRVTYPRDPIYTTEAEKMAELFNNPGSNLPSSDEPAKYIKIKNGLYLFNLTEANSEIINGANMPFRSNTMCFLQNYNKMRQVGRSFGTNTKDGVDTETHIMFASYGKFVDPDSNEVFTKMLTDPNPFITDGM